MAEYEEKAADKDDDATFASLFWPLAFETDLTTSCIQVCAINSVSQPRDSRRKVCVLRLSRDVKAVIMAMRHEHVRKRKVSAINLLCPINCLFYCS